MSLTNITQYELHSELYFTKSINNTQTPIITEQYHEFFWRSLISLNMKNLDFKGHFEGTLPNWLLEISMANI